MNILAPILLAFFIFIISTVESVESQQKEKKNTETKKEETKDQDDRKPEPEKLVKIGNLAFPGAQQPQPLIAFGQNILEKKQSQFLFQNNYIKNRRESFLTLIPSILHGLNDDFSILVALPIAARYKIEDKHSSGLDDMFIQMEYAPLTIEKGTYYDQFTIVASFTIPTGSVKKKPPTGTGTNSFFIGGIYARMGIDWFYFTSYGRIFNTENRGTQFGDIFLYQGGIGRRIFSTPKWLGAFMVEMDGIYFWKDKFRGIIDPNTGGNVIYVTPSIFISSIKHLVFQFGMGFPVTQHLFGHQNRKEYLIGLNVDWTF